MVPSDNDGSDSASRSGASARSAAAAASQPSCLPARPPARRTLGRRPAFSCRGPRYRGRHGQRGCRPIIHLVYSSQLIRARCGPCARHPLPPGLRDLPIVEQPPSMRRPLPALLAPRHPCAARTSACCAAAFALPCAKLWPICPAGRRTACITPRSPCQAPNAKVRRSGRGHAGDIHYSSLGTQTNRGPGRRRGGPLPPLLILSW